MGAEQCMSCVRFYWAESGAQRCTAQMRQTKLCPLLMGVTVSAHAARYRKASPVCVAHISHSARKSFCAMVCLIAPTMDCMGETNARASEWA